MSNEHWTLLDSIQEKLNRLSDLPPGIMYALAERIEEAISAPSRAPLEALSIQLAEFFDALLRIAPKETVDAVCGPRSADSGNNAAYLLGQLSFAQLLTAQAYERRADDRFIEILRDHRYQPYIRALYTKECTGTQLAKTTGECEETVSRKLKLLRELGITDFRREGRHLLNFLTPVTQAVVKEFGIVAHSDELSVEPKKIAL
jgi:DNA-binding transcriptional ArsR family regulator